MTVADPSTAPPPPRIDRLENGAAHRLAGLDGLRGLSMLLVVFCHLQLLHIGWMGVNAFFVLSGFLITRVLRGDARSTSSFGDHLRRFYIRRSLRVVPPYYAYLVVLTAAALAAGLRPARDQLPSAYLYVFNFHHLLASHVATRALDHLWSLSVEEQFYLFWPFVLWLTPSRAIRPLLFALAASGPLWRGALALAWPPDVGVALTASAPVAIYVSMISHLDAFAMGALLNFVQYRPRAWQLVATLSVMLAAGMAFNGVGLAAPTPSATYGILGWPMFLPNAGQSVWGYTVLDFFWFQVVAAILWVPAVRRCFSLRALEFLGKVSYAAYIVHYPILGLYAPLWWHLIRHFGRIGGTLTLLPVYLPTIIAVAAFSHRFIEAPALRLKDRFASQGSRRSPLSVASANEIAPAR
jgi:peptidoglycan/LPS O-acetylase OafA/YrhL